MSRRPTKAERREATKQARLEAQKRAQKARRTRFLYGGIGVAAFGGLIAAIVLASGSGTTVNVTSLNRAAAAAGCSALQIPKDLGRQHVPQGTNVTYDSAPPTSGSHYNVIAGLVPAPTGVHTNPIQNEIQVHNLEHGHIGFQYGPTIDATVRDSLESFTRSHDTWIFMAPYPSMPSGTILAFTAWDRIISCSSPTDASAVTNLAKIFYDDYHGQGPEFIPGTPLSG